MKVLRILAVILVFMAGIGGYFYSLQSNGATSEDGSEYQSRSEDTTNEDSSSTSSSKKSPKTYGTKSDETSDEYEWLSADVLEVFDGDTIKARSLKSSKVLTVRVKGIDCPESSRDVDKCWSENDLIDIPCPDQVPLGKRATDYAKKRLANERIELESYDGFKEGDYGRTLAYIRTPDGKDYSLETVKKGFCKDSGVRYDHPRDDQYKPHRRGIKR